MARPASKPQATKATAPQAETDLAAAVKADAARRAAQFRRQANAQTRLPRRSPLQPRDIRRADAKGAFLAALAHGWSVSRAAKFAGVNKQTVYEWQHKDPHFAAAWLEAERSGTDMLVDVAMQRAIIGTRKPIWFEGQIVGYEREVDNGLLGKLLAARDSRFATRRHEHVGAGGGPVQIEAAKATDKGLTRDQAFQILIAEQAGQAAGPATATPARPTPAGPGSAAVGHLPEPVHSARPPRKVPKPHRKAAAVSRRPKA